LKPLCDRATLTGTHRDLVDGPDRRDLGGGSSEEDFVGDLELLSRDHLFH